MILQSFIMTLQCVLSALLTGLFLWLLFTFSPLFSNLIINNQNAILNNPTQLRDSVFVLPLGSGSSSIKKVDLIYEIEGTGQELLKLPKGHKMTVKLDDLRVITFEIDNRTLINDSPYNPSALPQILKSGQRLLIKTSFDFKTNSWRTDNVRTI